MLALTVFLGSFILFAIQPMLGRLLLPGFGGAAAVWSVCLATYQVLLLAGYVYAHYLVKASRRRQWRWHGVALGVAAGWCLLMAWGWQKIYSGIGNSQYPSFEVLMYVMLIIGLPYVLLASGSSLLQAWQARREGRGVYRLYAVSNLGSFSGLFCYSLLIEPGVSLTSQWWGFGGMFCVYGFLVVLVGWRLQRGSVNENGEASMPTVQKTSTWLPALTHPAWWYVLPGLSSFLLVAVTNHLTLEVTPIPLMWAVLLGVFLLSYVIGFSRLGERFVDVWAMFALGGLAVVAYVAGIRGEMNYQFFSSLLGCGVAFGCICIFLHSWLYVIRPYEQKALTRFYLGVAGGGAVGGILGSLVCPVVFNTILEWPIGILLVNGCLIWYMWKRQYKDHTFAYTIIVVLCCIPVFLLHNLHTNQPLVQGKIVKSLRNFYGTLSIARSDVTVEGERKQDIISFLHGRTMHGGQRMRYWESDKPTIPEKNANKIAWEGFPLLKIVQKFYVDEPVPNAYFGPSGGGAAVLSRLHAQQKEFPLRVGVVGLGIGTLAAWGRQGDFYRFYEINPDVVEVALSDQWFTFLTGAKAEVEVVIGDARKVLETEERKGYPGWDVLFIDAYSGDAIPLHLATHEAFALYRRRLAKDGILVVQMTNWHINLLPLVKKAAEENDMNLRGVVSMQHGDYTASMWAFLSVNEFELVRDEQHSYEIEWDKVTPMSNAPSDFRGSLLPLVKFYKASWDIPQKQK